MKFYSGFSLSNESTLFESFIKDSQYTVCGFSYGAIKALQATKKILSQGKRVDTLQLFSPAFFQTKSQKFKRLQTLGYTKNKEKYLLEFINSCFLPYEKKDLFHVQTSFEELEELLSFEWSSGMLLELQSKGVVVEVYLGGLDAVIDVENAKDFFLEFSTVTYIKEANHFLQTN